MPLPPLKIIISGVDNFSQTLSKTLKTVNKVTGGMTRTGNVMRNSITIPIGLAAGAIFKSAYNFDKYMNMVEAKSTVAGTSIETLRKQALDLGKSTSFSHIQAAEGMQYLAQAGYNTDQIFKAITPTLHLAQATSIELGQAADWLTNIMGGMGLEAHQASSAAAILATTTAKANVTMENLAFSFAGSAPIAKKYGVSLQDLSAIMGFLGNIGIKGTNSATALKNMLVNLAAPTTAGSKVLSHFGIGVERADGKIKNIKTTLLELSKVLPKVTESQGIKIMNTLFGKRAIAATSAMVDNVGKQNGKLLELVSILNKVEPTDLISMVNIMRKGSVSAWDDFVSAFQGFGQAIADSGFLKGVNETLIFMTQMFRKLILVNPEILKLATKIALITAAIGPLLVFGAMAINSFMVLGTSIAAAGGMVALLTNPVTIAIGAIVAITAVVVSLWGELKPLGIQIWEIAKDISAKFNPVVEAMGDHMKELWGQVSRTVTLMAKLSLIILDANYDPASEGVDSLANSMANLIKHMTPLVEITNRLLDGLNQIATKIRPFVKYAKMAEKVAMVPFNAPGEAFRTISKLGRAAGFDPFFTDRENAAEEVYGNGRSNSHSSVMLNRPSGYQTPQGRVIVDFRNPPEGMSAVVEGNGITGTSNKGTLFAGGGF